MTAYLPHSLGKVAGIIKACSSTSNIIELIKCTVWYIHVWIYICMWCPDNTSVQYLVQEENELHERLAELQRKERFLMSRGRDQIKPPEQGAHTDAYIHMYMYSQLLRMCTCMKFVLMHVHVHSASSIKYRCVHNHPT